MITEQRKKELHEEAGLVDGGFDSNGFRQYIGTDKQWSTYEIYLENESRIEDLCLNVLKFHDRYDTYIETCKKSGVDEETANRMYHHLKDEETNY